MNQQVKEEIAERVNEMHLQLESLKENISQCLTAMHSLSDGRERATSDKLRLAYIEALDSPIAEELSQLPTDNVIAFVAAFAALKLAYSSINAYSTAWDLDVAFARGNKNNVVQ